MAESKRQNLPGEGSEEEEERRKRICLPSLSEFDAGPLMLPLEKARQEKLASVTPLPERQNRLCVSMKSLWPYDAGPWTQLSKGEGRSVGSTVVMDNGEEVDLARFRMRKKKRPEGEVMPLENSEKPSLEWMALQFEKARQERREKGCESVHQDRLEYFILEYEKENREKLAQGEGEGGGGGYVIVPPEKRQNEIKQGECLKGGPLNPYCNCSPLSCFEYNNLVLTPPIGAVEEYAADYVPIWLTYLRQLRQTHCFDIDVHPGPAFGAGISPYKFNKDAELLMELANRAVEEYNEKECNVFKYKVLKIEKVNLLVTDYFEYWMTVKVLNLSLGTPIETFQIHAGKSCLNDDAKVIYCCQPKEEAVVGLANCDLCFGKLRGEVCQGGKEKALEV